MFHKSLLHRTTPEWLRPFEGGVSNLNHAYIISVNVCFNVFCGLFVDVCVITRRRATHQTGVTR